MNTAIGDFPQITVTGFQYGDSSGFNDDLARAEGSLRRLQAFQQRFGGGLGSHEPDQDNEYQNTRTTPMSTRRIVKVFIADPHPDVPMGRALLYQGGEKWTDATDQELFFEIGINDLLATYNADRVKWLDKEASRKAGKDIFLEPVRIRDLRMVVVEIAKF